MTYYPTIFIMGVSGAGKTTIGQLLAAATAIPFYDADDFHSVSNKAKMNAAIPLTDEDRMQWLSDLHALAKEQQTMQGIILACSALKEKYRLILEEGIAKPVWILLQGSYDLVAGRLQKRKGHYMSPALLQSQYDALEIPGNAFTIDIGQPPAKQVEFIIQHLRRMKNNIT